MQPPRITYDAAGTPGIWGESPAQAYAGLGFVHGRHRPLQTLLLATAARGELSERLVPRRDLALLDAMVHRLDLPRRGRAAAGELEAEAALYVDAYLEGVRRGLAAGGRPFELYLLAATLPAPDRASVLSGLLLSAYLGLAESQERMERLLTESLAEGASPALLERMFAPHLAGWQPELLARVRSRPQAGFAAHGRVAVGGSNAWAVGVERSASGGALLAGDPHLQIDQLPGLFLEVRARVGDDYWLGASIPGLPGLAVGRNRRVAWSGTFAVADNVDFTIETLERGSIVRGEARHDVVLREVELRRRIGSPVRLRFHCSDRGVLEEGGDGPVLAASWAALDRPAEALAAYVALPLAPSAAAAERLLERAHVLSLHFVIADRGGEVRYCQAGRVPRRSSGWSGLYPAAADAARWVGFYEGSALPRQRAQIVASANEARPAADGAALATLAQPGYRLERITSVLAARRDHDLQSFRALQLDRLSLQARRLVPRFLPHLAADSPLRSALASWDHSYELDRQGAHAFELCYAAAREALAADLGGEWMRRMLARTEVSVWWCAAFDRLLDDDVTWSGPSGARLGGALALLHDAPHAWGEVQRFSLRHMLLGGLGLGFDRGPYGLPGSIATVQQGNLVPAGDGRVAVGPAYRFITDLSEDAAHSAMPGGIDGSRFCGTYARWLDDWRDGVLHRLVPPVEGERP